MKILRVKNINGFTPTTILKRMSAILTYFNFLSPFSYQPVKSVGIGVSLHGKRGFTLVELLLYVAISAIIFSGVSTFLAVVLESRVKNQTVVEVEQVGVQALQIILQTIRSSGGINYPAIGTGATSASFNVFPSENSPTIFDLVDSVIRIKEGAASLVSLTSSRVSASNLRFTNLSRAGTPGIVMVQFTLSHINLSGRNEYDYTRNFTASASLR